VRTGGGRTIIGQPQTNNTMNTSKEQYISSIRSNTAYPVYRGFIDTIALLGYLLAGVDGLGALIMGFSSMKASFIYGVGILVVGAIFAALVFLLARFFKEAALILADIGDSTAEANSRTLVPQAT
jgi:hypothetical protein